MNLAQRPVSFEAADYVGVLRRRWLIVVVLTIIGVAGAFAYTVVAPKTYSGVADVNVTPTGAAQTNNSVANSRTGSASVNLDTQAQLVTSAAVAAAAGKLMHSSLTPWQLSQNVTVTVPPNSSVLTITCKAPTATGAATCANDFAAVYLKQVSATSSAIISAQLAKISSEVTSLEQQAAALSVKISSEPVNSSERLLSQTDLNSVNNQLHALTNQEATLTGEAANSSGGSIITPATPQGKPTDPKKAIVLPSGLVAGLLLGLIFAFVWDRRDKRIHGADDVERLLDVPVLLKLPGRRISQQLSLAPPRSRSGQAFTEFTHAVAATLGEGSHVVVVAGTAPGPGASLVAANLAATLARTQSDVVLICANLEDDAAAGILGVEDGRGLAEVLAGRATVRDVALNPAAVPGLWVITPGADPSLAVYNLQHDTAQALTSQLRRDVRYVIIDAQATDDGADTFALAEFADAAVITVETDRTTRPAAGEAIRRLEQLRTPVIGAAVLPAVSPSASVRPPRPAQPRPDAGQEETRHEASVGRRPGELSALSARASKSDNGRDRRPRVHEGYGDPADKVPGS